MDKTIDFTKLVNTCLSKEDAILAIKKGYWVQHRYFDDNEMISMKGPKIIDENGLEMDYDQFWKYRSEPKWDKDWLLLSDISVEKRKRF